MLPVPVDARQPNLQGTAVKLGRVKLQVAYAPGKSPTIVCIHGGLGSRTNWCLQWDFFRAQGQAILAYDLAGHGESDRYGRYSVGRHRRDLTRLLHHFKIHHPILCCHSYGVPIGLEWAKRHAITGLIAIGGGTHNLTPWWEIPVMKFFAIGGHQLHKSALVQEKLRSLMNPNFDRTLERFYTENSFPAEAHPYEVIEAFWGYDGRYPDLSCPVTVITGSNDPMFPPAMGHEWLAHLRQNQLHSHHISVTDARHLIMAEAPQVVNQAILDMMALTA
jgi:pimeloyl-ACP methyl ester carboxylesterase